jgi:hypothetical protein
LTGLLIVAIVVAVVSVPTIAGLTAWGLAGGDGEPDNALMGVLAVLVGGGGVYNALASWLAFQGLAEWQWWLMLVAPVAGLLGLVSAPPEQQATTGDWVIGVLMQAGLAVPWLLVWLAGGVG